MAVSFAHTRLKQTIMNSANHPRRCPSRNHHCTPRWGPDPSHRSTRIPMVASASAGRGLGLGDGTEGDSVPAPLWRDAIVQEALLCHEAVRECSRSSFATRRSHSLAPLGRPLSLLRRSSLFSAEAWPSQILRRSCCVLPPRPGQLLMPRSFRLRGVSPPAAPERTRRARRIPCGCSRGVSAQIGCGLLSSGQRRAGQDAMPMMSLWTDVGVIRVREGFWRRRMVSILTDVVAWREDGRNH